jgi:acyl-homoserine-lactone acylase
VGEVAAFQVREAGVRLRSLMAAAGLALAIAGPAAAADSGADLGRWRAQALRVTITRDDWGIAHVRGKSDADAVFGMAYAQAEDDFNRVETNYLTSLGRTAEAEGAGAIWADLRQKLYIDPADLKAKYAASPAWLKALMDGWADGLNFYLATHPQTKPRVITRFEPWMALSFSEGSIGGDIERISLGELEKFYGGARSVARDDPYAFREPSGSNGIALSPKVTKDDHALLLINPHTSFFFRSELQMTSEEGLNAYGAVTWGQFFIYQGFNPHAGWMHTSSGVDVVDEFAEAIVRTPGALMYRYGREARPVTVKQIAVPYRAADGSMASRTFTTYRTHHGPIVREQDGRWIAFAMMFRPVEALQQSFLRTKAVDYASFAKVAELKANSSNNTLFADDKGETAYLHPQFIPKRDGRFDYTKPVDGSDPATDWQGLTELAATPQVLNAPWSYNSNDAPWMAAGPLSPKREAFPRYMDQAGMNPRGPHAVRVLDGRTDFTREGLMRAAYDPYLTAFARLIPGLAAAYDAAPAGDATKARLAPQVAALKAWDFRWSAASTETSLAVFWGEALWAKAAPAAKAAGMSVWDYMAERSPASDKLAALAEASDRLTADFGSWQVPWGEINRFQRLNGDIVQQFRDDGPSIPVPFTSAQWGSLASFGAKRYPGTKRYYGTSGNSFVAVVEFGPKVRAVAVTAGGESGHPESPHFNDQAGRYAAGDLREVYFWPEQLTGHTERTYRPGGEVAR